MAQSVYRPQLGMDAKPESPRSFLWQRAVEASSGRLAKLPFT